MNKKQVIKVVAFSLVFCLVFRYATYVLRMKSFNGNAETYGISSFYNWENNTVDTLLIGSSNMVMGMSAPEMYLTNGITAASLATSNQSLMVSYYMLKEAKRTQDIKTVVLDVSMLFEASKDADVRRAIDNMKFSTNKLELIRKQSQNDNGTDFEDYLFPIIKFHSRWTELQKTDFAFYPELDKTCFGSSLRGKCTPLERPIISIDIEEEHKEYELKDFQVEYLDKIVAYCEQEQIQLLFIKIPKGDWCMDKHQKAKKLADDYGIEFLDFNTEELLQAIDFDTEKDMYNFGHLNVSGNIKLTHYVTDYLVKNYNMVDRRDENVVPEEEITRYISIRDSQIQRLQK